VLFNIGEPGETGGCILHNLACRSASACAVVPLVCCPDIFLSTHASALLFRAALNQLGGMQGGKDKLPKNPLKKKKSVVAGLGMGLTASALLATPQADAATEMAQLAASDGRLGILAVLFVPVVRCFWNLLKVAELTRHGI